MLSPDKFRTHGDATYYHDGFRDAIRDLTYCMKKSSKARRLLWMLLADHNEEKAKDILRKKGVYR